MNVFFYTSNVEKLLQARLLFMRHGYDLKHFKGDREPYDEDYALGTKALLMRAIQQVNREFGVRSIFFVEDTSLRIDVLSAEKSFPGLAVKEWFSKTTFSELDADLKGKGNDRHATVHSDIALYLPTLSEPLFFHGESAGHIADEPPNFEPSIQYPWLTPHTFNGWFWPEGAKRRLGEMEFEESLAFDFRAKSLSSMLSRLEELNAALNLRPNFYTVRRPAYGAGQLSLIPQAAKTILLVVGDKCAGKSTFSDHMTGYEDVRVYEASNVLRLIAEQKGVIPGTADEALLFLETFGWDVVASKIAQYIETSDALWDIVTGLRTPEELLLLKRRFPESHIVLIDADARIRFERHIKRARDQEIRSFQSFAEQDAKQRQFGVMRVATEIADFVINNEASISSYKSKIDALLGGITSTTSRDQRPRPFSEIHRCLSALRLLASPATCEQISDATAELGGRVRVYNTNRALKELPEFANRIQHTQSLLQYGLTERGRALVELLDILKGFPRHLVDSLELPFS